MNLSELEQGKTAKISRICLEETLRQRLLDFGMVQNTPITRLQTAPGGNPIAYFIRGTVIALRKEDAKRIELD